MKIGIDISQTAYQGTGVANYLVSLVEHLLENDKENEYILFFSGMRKGLQDSRLSKLQKNANVTIRTFPFPPKLLDLVWNKLHIIPIETLIGDIDIFITSDWTEPPARAIKATILYDLIVYKFPEETDAGIIATQKRRLAWMKRESSAILCISEATMRDAEKILHIPKEKMSVIYPGFSLEQLTG